MRSFEGHGPLPPIRNGEAESRAFSGLRCHPDPSAGPVDHFPAKRQADARPRIFLARMQTLEDPKNALEILWVDPNTVVARRKLPLSRTMFHLNVDLRRTFAAVFDGIADEIL